MFEAMIPRITSFLYRSIRFIVHYRRLLLAISGASQPALKILVRPEISLLFGQITGTSQQAR